VRSEFFPKRKSAVVWKMLMVICLLITGVVVFVFSRSSYRKSHGPYINLETQVSQVSKPADNPGFVTVEELSKLIHLALGKMENPGVTGENEKYANLKKATEASSTAMEKQALSEEDVMSMQSDDLKSREEEKPLEYNADKELINTLQNYIRELRVLLKEVQNN